MDETEGAATARPAGGAHARRAGVLSRALRPSWRSRYRRTVLITDLVATVVGVSVALEARFGSEVVRLTGPQIGFVALLPFLWMLCLGVNRAYETRFLGAGTIEFERVARSFLHMTAVTAFSAFAIDAAVSRGFVLIALATVITLQVSARYAVRKVVHARRRAGRATVPVLAVGSSGEIARFTDTLAANQHTGLRVVGACAVAADDDEAEPGGRLADRGIPVLGDVDSLRETVERCGAESVAVISRDISGEKLRWISWQLEGTGTDLVVMPGLTEVAGRRLDIQQVGGLPLLYVAQPEFSGLHRVLKAAFDRTLAAVGLLLLAPLLLVIALVIRVTSRGPALFLQERVGKDGKTFRMVKFRSMCRDAESLLSELREQNEFSGGTLFKIKADPRVTAVGRILRKYSLDELPQLLNVLAGSMSLVGPRPPLPSEVAGYGGEVHRRLLVKPGITGLWQISGRSDLSWEESVRLDLRYVESWSLTLDLIVLVKTVRAVARPAGAY